MKLYHIKVSEDIEELNGRLVYATDKTSAILWFLFDNTNTNSLRKLEKELGVEIRNETDVTKALNLYDAYVEEINGIDTYNIRNANTGNFMTDFATLFF
jgi:hypothetical protein